MNDGASPHILVLNCGSSSLKFGLFRPEEGDVALLVSGEASAVGQPSATFRAAEVAGRKVFETSPIIDQQHVVGRVLDLLQAWTIASPAAVGHRIVHGGPKLRQHCLIDDRVTRLLQAASPFAPLHIPEALKVIGATQAAFPSALQAACFDTTFHASIPDVARILPIPRELETHGVFRYGFHGLSCESIVHQLGKPSPERLVIAHLGAGASVSAVRGSVSIDTSMGMTPTSGVMMGTRSGDIDPGVLLYLMREKGFDAARLEDLVDRRSGLLGVSGLSGDMLALQTASPSNPDARLAISMFAYQVRKEIAGMISALGGVDTLVFTGGIGEADAPLRAAICAGLACMGVHLDPTRNCAPAGPVSTAASPSKIYVLPSQEDLQIARHTRALMGTVIP